jgi:hypothetical protein
VRLANTQQVDVAGVAGTSVSVTGLTGSTPDSSGREVEKESSARMNTVRVLIAANPT